MSCYNDETTTQLMPLAERDLKLREIRTEIEKKKMLISNYVRFDIYYIFCPSRLGNTPCG